MFGRFFGSKDKTDAKPAAKSAEEIQRIAHESLMRVLADKKKEDPLIGLKVGSKEIYNRVAHIFKNERGVHIETLLTALGALSGFSCQMAVRAELFKLGHQNENSVLMNMTTEDGRIYYFGDPLNKLLAENKVSIWTLAAGAAKQVGCDPLPDVGDMFGYSIKTLGTPEFGIPRVPEKHRSMDTGENIARALWPALKPILDQFCDHPKEWPLIYAMAIQRAIDTGKEVLPPDIALRISMETAIATSKLDPGPQILKTILH